MLKLEESVPCRGIANLADQLAVLEVGVYGQVCTRASTPLGVAQGSLGNRDDERSQRRRLAQAVDRAEQVEKDVLLDVLPF